jgi:hypothetical protein
MTAYQVQAIAPTFTAFTAFLQPLERFFDTPKTVRHFRNDSRGLLTDLPGTVQRSTASVLFNFKDESGKTTEGEMRSSREYTYEGDGVIVERKLATSSYPATKRCLSASRYVIYTVSGTALSRSAIYLMRTCK